MNIRLLYFLVIISFWKCKTPEERLNSEPLEVQKQTITALKERQGYAKHPITNQKLEPIKNSKGETIQTGIPLPFIGKKVHADSISSPEQFFLKGDEKKTPYKKQFDITPAQYEPTKIPIYKDELQIISINTIDTLPAEEKNKMVSGKAVPYTFNSSDVDILPFVECDNPTFKDNTNLNILNYGELQGLSDENVNSLFKDKEGNLWICTYSHGLARYDGHFLKHFILDDGYMTNQIKCGLEDKSGNIWIGSYDLGIYKYDGQNFTHIPIEKDKPFYNVSAMIEDKEGNIWCGVDKIGVIKITDSHYTIYSEKEGLCNNSVTSLLEDKAGNIWIGSSGGGVSKFNGKEFTNYSKKTGLVSNDITCINEDLKGNIWMGTFIGALKFDGTELTHYTAETGLGNNEIRCISADETGSVWLGTWGNGITKYDGNDFWNITKEEGLSSNIISGIYPYDEDNIWISTLGGGISKYKTNSFNHISKEHGFSGEQISSILEDRNGNLWFASYYQGLYKFDGESFTLYTTKDGLCSDKLVHLTEDSSGNIWIASYGNGVSKFDGESFTNYNKKSGLSGNLVWSIIEDKSNQMWFSFYDGGITKFDGNEFIHYSEDGGLSTSIMWSLKEDSQGNIWMGSHGNGISKFDGSKITHYSYKEGFTGELVWNIHEDEEGNMWFGTFKNSVIKFDGENFTRFFHNERIGIKSINHDKSNNIWLSSDVGVKLLTTSGEQLSGDSVFYEQASEDLSIAYNQVSLDYYYGLRIKGSYLGSGIIDSKNRYWIGTPKHLSYLDLNKFKARSNIPQVALRQLDINSNIIDFRTTAQNQFYDYLGVREFENYPHELELKHDQNHLTFYFSASDIMTSHLAKYSYLLEGSDEDWSRPKKVLKADYRNLVAGDYTFKVKAQGENLIWGKTFNYSFTIHPPWYLSHVAKFSYLLLGFLAFRGLINLRTKRLKRRQDELISEVNFATRKLSAQRDAAEEQKKIIEVAHKEITDSIQYAKRIQKAIIPSTEMVKEKFPESFIFYQPKDVVAGDFYWMENVGEKTLIAAADCTGHGVPGAMVSVICNNGLNRSVREHGLTVPGEILDKTRELVVEEFKKSTEDVKDGMDIALCSFNGSTLQYAGANISLCIINDGVVMQTKPNKQPIGQFDNPVPYTTYNISLNAGDNIYLFTDGYVDQFGGEKGKKLKRAAFLDLLKEVHNQPMATQKMMLAQHFKEWKGENEQIDDVCVVGIKISNRGYEAS